jgi:hypothetical protein
MTARRYPHLRSSSTACAGFGALALAGFAVVGTAGEVQADVPPPAPNHEAEDAAESRATSFQAVEGSTAEQVPGGMLLVAAYAVVLVLLVAYVGRLGSLQRRNQNELVRLSEAVERARKG